MEPLDYFVLFVICLGCFGVGFGLGSRKSFGEYERGYKLGFKDGRTWAESRQERLLRN